MNASWNQRYNLYMWAKRFGYMNIYDELELRSVIERKMSVQRYKMIRDAIIQNQPGKALKMIKYFPIDYNKIDVSPRGGEL